MPRIPRNYLKTSFFHIMSQGLNKSFIFNDPIDIKFYIKSMYSLIKQFDVKIIAYCIMNNHVHILIETKNINELSKYMQFLNSRYAMYYNKKYKRVGYVFRDRYASEGIYSEKQLYNCINYIYNNPVKAGMCSKPEEYKFSNYKKIEFNVSNEYGFIDIDEDKIELCKNVIAKYLNSNQLRLEELKKDRIKLKELLVILKKKNKISFRIISEIIRINRETLRQKYEK